MQFADFGFSKTFITRQYLPAADRLFSDLDLREVLRLNWQTLQGTEIFLKSYENTKRH